LRWQGRANRSAEGPRACLAEQLESHDMAHREQHSNRETRKPKKEKSREGNQGPQSKWVVNEAVEAKANGKH
jgi:hypothetical protein